jgi:hypothetical protein
MYQLITLCAASLSVIDRQLIHQLVPSLVLFLVIKDRLYFLPFVECYNLQVGTFLPLSHSDPLIGYELCILPVTGSEQNEVIQKR